MTDEKLIKSLEMCANNGNCKDCFINPHKGNYGYCTSLAIKEALDLINRQKAEIERLQNRIVFWREYMDYRPDELKAEAIKRFVERLREYAISDEFGTMVDIDDIDNLIEETIGE